MVVEVITINEENQHLQEKLIAGRTIHKVVIGNGEKYLTVGEEGADTAPPADETDTMPLEDLLRKELDVIAVKLELEPSDYRTKAIIADAIREKAESEGIDINTLIE